MDGYKLAAAVRAEEHEGQRLPIIALTANVMREDHQRYLEAGCQALLGKPIVQHDFYAMIRNYTRKAQQLEHHYKSMLISNDYFLNP